MIEPRIYRAAFMPALLAVVLAMFSFESQPAPAAAGAGRGRALRRRPGGRARARGSRPRQPDRRAGSAGDRATAALRRPALRATAGSRVEARPLRFSDAGRELVNVIGRRAGGSRRQIVIVAARDAAGVPDAPGSAADTAALLELARVFEGRPRARRSCSLGGRLDARRGRHEPAGRRLPEPPTSWTRSLVISDLGARRRAGRSCRPGRTTRPRRASGSQRTVADSLRQELGAGARRRPARSASSRGSRSRSGSAPRACCSRRATTPCAISGSGELPRRRRRPPWTRRRGPPRRASAGRPCARSPRSTQGAGRRARPGLLPAGREPGAARLGALAARGHAAPAGARGVGRRLRARAPAPRCDVLPWLRWLGAWVGALPGRARAGRGARARGATPAPPAAPVRPACCRSTAPALGRARRRGRRRWCSRCVARALARGAPRARAADAGRAGRRRGRWRSGSALGAGCCSGLVNPFAGAARGAAAHLWMLATLVAAAAAAARAHRAGRARAAARRCCVAIYHLFALSLDPLCGRLVPVPARDRRTAWGSPGRWSAACCSAGLRRRCELAWRIARQPRSPEAPSRASRIERRTRSLAAAAPAPWPRLAGRGTPAARWTLKAEADRSGVLVAAAGPGARAPDACASAQAAIPPLRLRRPR